MFLDVKMEQDLMKAAIKARENSYTPYSGYKVGAALLCEDGCVVNGCNIENAAYTPTNCAERTAFFKAVSEGKREFVAIAIVGGFNDHDLAYAYPCGVCRQVMTEFVNAETFKIIVGKGVEDYNVVCLDELFPHSFGPHNLGE